MTMTYQQAVDQATKLRTQGLTYKQIEDHLKAAGYVSARTKQPIKEMAIRYMVTKEEAEIKKAAKDEIQDEKPIHVTVGSQSVEDFKKELRVLLSLEGISKDTKDKLLEVMMAPRQASVVSTPQPKRSAPAEVQTAMAQ